MTDFTETEGNLSPDELVVASDLWLCRQAGKAAPLRPEYYPAAFALHQRGWVDRRFQDGTLVWEFSDTGIAALDLNNLLTAHEGRQN